MLHYAAALRRERRHRRLRLLDATAVAAGGNSPAELFRKLED